MARSCLRWRATLRTDPLCGSDGELGSDFEQEEGEEDEDIGDRWGKRKRTYYNTDYVDSEIVSSDDEGSRPSSPPSSSPSYIDHTSTSSQGRGRGGVVDAEEEAQRAE